MQESDELSYEFTTEQGIKYKIYFIDYSQLFAEYSDIKALTYTFNIDAIEGNPDTVKRDYRIAITVNEILKLFFQKVENVIVYTCDSLDRRQIARKRLFDVWYWKFNDGAIIKEDCFTIIEETEIYTSILISKNNATNAEIIKAFKEIHERGY